MDKKAQWALVGAAWFLALAVGVLGWLAWRHFLAPQPSPAAAYALQADGSAVCPVTGKKLAVDDKTPRVDYQGTVYYFAADVDAEGRDARTRFLMAPDTFLRPPAPR